jgi:hypothetical protein
MARSAIGYIRPIVLTIALMMMVSTTALSYTVEDYEGAPSVELRFNEAGNRTLNISIPTPFKVISGDMNVTGGPLLQGSHIYPTDVTVDVGADGDIEWAYSGQGYGPLGAQDRFHDNATIKEVHVNGPTSKALKVLIPDGAVVTDASVTISGHPSVMRTAGLGTDNITHPPSVSDHYEVEGITEGEIALNATVTLSDAVVLPPAMDLDQSKHNNMFFMDLSMRTGQSFRINRSDPRQEKAWLYAIEIYVTHNDPTDVGLELRLYNANETSGHGPTGDIIANSTVWVDDIPSGGYVNFSFDPPVELEAQRVYTMVLRERFTSAITGHFDFGFHWASTGLNPDSKYPVPGCWMHTSDDSGQTWAQYSGRDLRFRTYASIARPLDLVERHGIVVDSQDADIVDEDSLHFSIMDPDYDDTGWNFTVTNQLQHWVIYNLSSNISFHDLPEKVSVEISGDDLPEFYTTDDLSGFHVIEDLVGSFKEAIEANTPNGTADQYGNVLVPVPLTIDAHGEGIIRLENLLIEYTYSAAVADVKEAIESYWTTHQDDSDHISGQLVPVRVKVTSPGAVTLSGLAILYDGPPRVINENIEVPPIPEEGLNETLLDLGTIFSDDFDSDLELSVHEVNTTAPANGTIDVDISDEGYLTIDARDALNWTGTVVVLVDSTDSRGHITTSPPINITVYEVNDAPVITSTYPMVAIEGEQYRYIITVVDSDDVLLNCWLVGAPPGMTLDEANMTIYWVPTLNDEGEHNITLRISDGEIIAEQRIHITVLVQGTGNRPPVVQEVPDQKVIIGQDLTLGLQAFDPDMDNITFSVVSGPEGLSVGTRTGVLEWTPTKTGDFKVTARVSDGSTWMDISFNITVLEKGRVNITITSPSKDEKVPRSIIISGKATSTGAKVTKVEYSIDDGGWYKADLSHDGAWYAEPDLSRLKKGTHTLVVKATDETGDVSQTYTTFSIKEGTTSSGGLSDIVSGRNLSIVLLLIAILAASIAAAAWSRGRAKERKGKVDGKAGGPDGPRSTKASSGPVRHDIDSAFLVYHDGRLITYSSKHEMEDPDATLQVIKDFVKSSFKGQVGRLDSLRYDNSNIILERGVQMYLVVITTEEDMKGLRRNMRRFLHDVHERFRHSLKIWDGSYRKVKGVGEMVEHFVSGRWEPKEGEGQTDVGEKGTEEPEGQEKESGPGPKSKRWDESPDMGGKDTAKVEKVKALEDKLLRGEITEKEFERLSRRLR